MQTGDNAPTAAVDAAVDWLYLEGRQDISDAVEQDRQDIALEHIHETAGDSTCDSEEGGNDEDETDSCSPHDLQISLDRLGEFVRATGNQDVSHYVPIRKVVACTFHVGNEADTEETVH